MRVVEEINRLLEEKEQRLRNPARERTEHGLSPVFRIEGDEHGKPRHRTLAQSERTRC